MNRRRRRGKEMRMSSMGSMEWKREASLTTKSNYNKTNTNSKPQTKKKMK